MSAFLRFIEAYFWAFFVAAFGLGLMAPSLELLLGPLVVPAIMMLTFLTLLRADLKAVARHLSRPLRLSYFLAGQLIVIPGVIYLAVSGMSEAFAVSCLLLAAMPPAIAAVALTELVKGDTSLSLTLTVLGHCIAPLSVTALFYLLVGTTLAIEWWSFVQHLVLIIVVPMVAALVVRHLARDFVERHEGIVNPASVLLLAVTVYTVAAAESETIIRDAVNLLPMVLGLYGLFLALYVIGHAWALRSTEKTKLAVCVTNTYMNNGLAIALAFTFLEPEVIVLVVLSEVPWITTLGLFSHVQKRLLFNRSGVVS